MDSFHKLIDIFREFPGIGPRQAKRFVYFLLAKDKAFFEKFGALCEALRKEMRQCESCFRYFQKRSSALCALCADPNRKDTELMIVARDTDLDAIEKSGGFEGRYFVLGGTLPLLEKKTAGKIRLKELLARVEKNAPQGLREVILALNANPDGEHTADELKKMLALLAKVHSLSITTLGRGLSTGSELEYADTETLKSALKNRAV